MPDGDFRWEKWEFSKGFVEVGWNTAEKKKKV